MLIALALLFQDVDPAPARTGYEQVRQMAVPVMADDIVDHPYRVIAEVTTDVRKWTVFEKDPSEQRVYRQLWDKAQKLGADAVVNARYGETLYGGWTWGRRHASGQAVHFLTAAEIALLPQHAKIPIAIPRPATQHPAASPESPHHRASVVCATCQ